MQFKTKKIFTELSVIKDSNLSCDSNIHNDPTISNDSNINVDLNIWSDPYIWNDLNTSNDSNIRSDPHIGNDPNTCNDPNMISDSHISNKPHFVRKVPSLSPSLMRLEHMGKLHMECSQIIHRVWWDWKRYRAGTSDAAKNVWHGFRFTCDMWIVNNKSVQWKAYNTTNVAIKI